MAVGGTPGAWGAAALILHPAAQTGGEKPEISAVSSPSLERGQEARGIEHRSGGRWLCAIQIHQLRLCGDLKEPEVCCQTFPGLVAACSGVRRACTGSGLPLLVTPGG